MALPLRDVRFPAGAIIGLLGDTTDLHALRREGATIFVVAPDEAFLLAQCDEVWRLKEGQVAWRGAARDALAPTMRRGDGRARVTAIETRPVWQSGEMATIAVTVRYEKDVEDPVVGILIRTWVGVEVYGTNTELEKVKLGPCAAGETRRVTFTFRCDLCPQQYTVTAASHDPDGVWHDWLEEAVSFSVTDTRYTAGVANLRASVSVERGSA
jgi:hypothetical protein